MIGKSLREYSALSSGIFRAFRQSLKLSGPSSVPLQPPASTRPGLSILYPQSTTPLVISIYLSTKSLHLTAWKSEYFRGKRRSRDRGAFKKIISIHFILNILNLNNLFKEILLNARPRSVSTRHQECHSKYRETSARYV